MTEEIYIFCRLSALDDVINALASSDLRRIKFQLFEKLENRKLCLEVKNKVLKSWMNFSDINIFIKHLLHFRQSKPTEYC